jgi:hypothetical protein
MSGLTTNGTANGDKAPAKKKSPIRDFRIEIEASLYSPRTVSLIPPIVFWTLPFT